MTPGVTLEAPYRILEDLLLGSFDCVLVGAALLIAQVYGPTQPLVLLLLPIAIAAALIPLIIVHDRRVASRPRTDCASAQPTR